MVEHQIKKKGINNPKLLKVMKKIPRHLFVPENMKSFAYEDRPLPIGNGQTISQPYVVALMLRELELQPSHRVLDIGAGSGYQSAVLSRLVGRVFAIERIDALAKRAVATLAELKIENVTITTGDGSLGWADEEPFDCIICGASAPEVPKPWIEQLSPGGRIIAPVGGRHTQTLVLVTKSRGKIHRRYLSGVRFVNLIGKHGW